LHDVRIWQIASGGESSFDGGTQIDSNNIARAPLCCQLRVTPFAASTFQHNFVFEKVRLDGRDPAEKLLVIPVIGLRKVLPLPAEIHGGGGLVALDSFQRSKSRHAARNGPGEIARLACEPAFKNLVRLALVRGRKIDRTGTSRA